MARGAGGGSLWPSVEALATLPRDVARFEPVMSAAERDWRYEGWRHAVARARSRGAAGAGIGMARIDELRLMAKVARLSTAPAPPGRDHGTARHPPVHRLAPAAPRKEAGIVRITLSAPSGLHSDLEDALAVRLRTA